MYRLVRELAAAGVPVIATTTTRILEPAEGTMPEVALGEGNASHIEVLRGMVEGRGFALTGSREAGGKIIGHSPEFVDSIRLENPDWVVVSECDGARGKSLKVPEAHEPPLPSLTSVYVVVIGADCMGERVNSAAVYNPEAVARVAGVTADALVDDGVVAATVLSPESYSGRKPAGARMSVLVNKVNPGDVLPAGDECTPVEDNPVIALANRLLSSGKVDGVVIGSVGRASGEAFAVLR
jgi:probable selenium-dependent hydroxylase accessory protein YqeC